jgi:hypothetical protein
MYFNEHPPPHFHVLTNSGEAAVFLIETLELRDGQVDRRDSAEALEWAAANREELIKQWHKNCEEDR